MGQGLGEGKAGVDGVGGGVRSAFAPALGSLLGKRNENRIQNTKQHPVNPPTCPVSEVFSCLSLQKVGKR